MGQRKIGKTSLLLELRRSHDSKVPMPYVDCWEARADPINFLCGLIRSLISAAVRQRGAEPEVGSLDPSPGSGFSPLVIQALARLGSPAIDEAVRLHESISSGQLDHDTLRMAFELPQHIAADLRIHVVVVLDEFQELQRLDRVRRLRRDDGDIFDLLRTIWQRQERVSYLLAGSRVTMMRRILTEENIDPSFRTSRCSTWARSSARTA